MAQELCLSGEAVAAEHQKQKASYRWFQCVSVVPEGVSKPEKDTNLAEESKTEPQVISFPLRYVCGICVLFFC